MEGGHHWSTSQQQVMIPASLPLGTHLWPVPLTEKFLFACFQSRVSLIFLELPCPNSRTPNYLPCPVAVILLNWEITVTNSSLLEVWTSWDSKSSHKRDDMKWLDHHVNYRSNLIHNSERGLSPRLTGLLWSVGMYLTGSHHSYVVYNDDNRWIGLGC